MAARVETRARRRTRRGLGRACRRRCSDSRSAYWTRRCRREERQRGALTRSPRAMWGGRGAHKGGIASRCAAQEPSGLLSSCQGGWLDVHELRGSGERVSGGSRCG